MPDGLRLDKYGDLWRINARHRQIQRQRTIPKDITLLHGADCSVCLTPAGVTDKAIEIASHPEVTFCP
jgi:hydrogenase expression/formation protein HypD